MGRLIKLRAWDKEKKGWVMPNHFHNISSSMPINEAFEKVSKNPKELILSESENIILMQYTGLKDRNSVEIYEGDLLIQQLIRYSPYHPNEDPEIVVFNTGCFCLAHKSGFTKRMNELSMVNEESEVIGNIYQNPELLK